MSKVYYQGETMRQNVEVRDIDDELINADTIVITIADPTGTAQVSGQDMIYIRKGEYRYDYLIAADGEIGDWKTEIKAVKGFTAIEQDVFTVMEAI